MLVEAYQRVGAGGMDLSSAVAKTNESLGLAVSLPDGVEIMDSQPSAVDNDAALADLQRMMSGIR